MHILLHHLCVFVFIINLLLILLVCHYQCCCFNLVVDFCHCFFVGRSNSAKDLMMEGFQFVSHTASQLDGLLPRLFKQAQYKHNNLVKQKPGNCHDGGKHYNNNNSSSSSNNRHGVASFRNLENRERHTRTHSVSKVSKYLSIYLSTWRIPRIGKCP